MTTPKPDIPGWPRGLSREMAAAYVGLSVTTFLDGVRRNEWPAPMAIGRRRVWDRAALDKVFDARGEAPPRSKPTLAERYERAWGKSA